MSRWTFWPMRAERTSRALARAALCCVVSACTPTPAPRAPVLERALTPEVWSAPEPPPPPEPVAEAPPEVAVDPAPIAGPGEVLVYRAGDPAEVITRHAAEEAGLLLLEVGSEWVPSLFRSTPELPHSYEQVFADLANGRFGDGYEGRRAAQERYLEPHGIPPSPALLARRFAELSDKPCREQLTLEPLRAFAGAPWPEGDPPPVTEPVVAALQKRLLCEGHMRSAPSGVLDPPTRAAIEEFERRSRIYARGSLLGETLAALREEPLELERRALVRVLTERALLELGIIEDGSAEAARPARADDDVKSAPNVVRALEQRITEALGLQTVDGVRRFYRRLTDALSHPHYTIAIDPVALPAYYADDMALWVEVDRGDFYYEFPFDEAGNPLDLPIERGPTLTVFARDGSEVRPLVSYPTTIGGWRVRRRNGRVHWEYKESTAGERAWRRIVTAPVWLPPRSTPSETLVATFRRTSDGSEFRELNQNLIGPSFASAYGLVAAYHQRIDGREDGELKLGGDDGMRTHGSSDYTSIWRTVSSGCHRLHNHLAIRLLNFILAHRAHRRVGHLPTSFRLQVSTDGFEERIDVSRTGYEFRLVRPLEVHVLPGRIRGELKQASRRRVPAAAEPSAWPTIVFRPEAREGRRSSESHAQSEEPAPGPNPYDEQVPPTEGAEDPQEVPAGGAEEQRGADPESQTATEE